MSTVAISRSGILISDMEEGIATTMGSLATKLDVSIKNVSNRKATSHMAVISTIVLFLGTLTFGMRKSNY
jgi:hypothetical protein